MQKARIHPNAVVIHPRNTVRLCVNAKAQIPPRSTLDDASTLQAPSRDVLLVEAYRPDTWHMDACPIRRFACIRKGNTGQPIALAFELRFLRQLLIATLPGKPGRIQHTL